MAGALCIAVAGGGFVALQAMSDAEDPTSGTSVAASERDPAAAPDAATVTLRGEVSLWGWIDDPYANDDIILYGGGDCGGWGPYEDISRGSLVTVYDGAGAIIATGELDGGRTSAKKKEDMVAKCSFPFIVENVPAIDFYQVEVAHRGKENFAADEIGAAVLPVGCGDEVTCLLEMSDRLGLN